MLSLTFQDMVESYINDTSFIYASRQANSYIKELVDNIDFSPYAISPKKYSRTRVEIHQFLCDTINQTLYAFKEHRESQGVWRRKLPLSNTKLRKQWPCLLINNRYTKNLPNTNKKVRRGIDVLINLGIIKNHGYKIGAYCSSFSVNPEILEKISVLNGNITINSILNEEYIDYSTGEVYSINSLLANNTTRKITPKGLLLSSDSTEFRKYKKLIDLTLLKRRNPVRVNIKKLISGMLKFINNRNLFKQTRLSYLVQCKSCIFSILRGKFLSIKQNRSIQNGISYKVAYYPTYKVASLGGRLFEIGGGIQFLKSSVRSACRDGVDYDLSSSQLNILKELCLKYKIPFKMVDLNKIAKNSTSLLRKSKYTIDIDKNDLKPILYGVLFGAGYFSKVAFKKLKEHLQFKCNITDRIFFKLKKLLKEELSGIATSVKSLSDKLMEDEKIWVKQGTSTYFCKNILGITFKTYRNRYKYLGCEATSKEREDRRKILAHIIQGIEMHKLLSIIKNTGLKPSSIEHDGALIDHYVNKVQAKYCESHNFIIKH